MASRSPSAVEGAPARPPAATRPEITYGRPAIAGVESTITAVLMTKSSKRRTPPGPAIAVPASIAVCRPPALRPQSAGRPGLLRAQHREPVFHQLLLAGGDFRNCLSVRQFGDRNAEMLC